MSVLDDIVDAPISITAEMWFCADSEQPTKTGAGRGAKQFIRIEDDCFTVYPSSREQTKVVASLRFRSMKLAAWFAHHPRQSLLDAKGGGAAAARRRAPAKDRPKAIYYYLVLEFVRDPAVAANAHLSKREHVVLCTEEKQDFDIWKKFTDLYESAPPLANVAENATAAEAKKAPPRVASAVAKSAAEETGGEFSSDGDDSDNYGRRAYELWRNRCVALLNDFAHLSDPSLQVQRPEDFGDADGQGSLNWDARAEAVVNAVERDMRPALKVLPHTAAEDAAHPSSSADTPATATSGACGAGRGTHIDDIRSQLSHLKVEIEQFQAAAAELGAYVEGRDLPAQSISPDTLRRYLARLPALAKEGGNAQTVTSPPPATAALEELELACRKAVSEFTDRVNSSSLALEEEPSREKAVQQERAPLPQRVELVFAVLLRELSSARDTTAKLKAALEDKTAPSAPQSTSVKLEMNELRRLLNRKELELEACQQQQFDESRRTRQLSRWFEAAVLLYADAAHDTLRSQYREYASLRNLFLNALRGDGIADSMAAADTASSVTGLSHPIGEEGRRGERVMSPRGANRLVISAAHMEAVMALEKERQAAKVKQQRLEDVITELDTFRQERDEEIANLKANFLAAKTSWARDVAVLQAKLAALQSSHPHGAVILPATPTDATGMADIMRQLKTSSAPTAVLQPGDNAESAPTSPAVNADANANADAIPESSASATAGQEALATVAAKLAFGANEANVDAGVITHRFQAFYEWALNTIVPLTATSTTDGSLLEMITGVVHAYHILLRQTSSIFEPSMSTSATDASHILSQAKDEHLLLSRLCSMIQTELLSPAAEDPQLQPTQDALEGTSEQTPDPKLSLPITRERLDEIHPFLQKISRESQLYRQLTATCNTKNLSYYIEQLQHKSAELDRELTEKAVREHLLDEAQKNANEKAGVINKNQIDFENALAALGVRAAADEPVGAAVARAAAEAAERERELRASLDAAAKREDALKAELEASRAAADERFAETDATRRELSDSVTSALAALGVRAEADEPVGAAVARAAAEAAERERELRASLDAAAKREDALRAELEASRAAADERFAETDATRRELSDSVTSALAALGVRAEADEPVGAAVARAAAEAAERERELRASLDAAAKREDALRAELEASRAAADERFAETDATRRELSDSVTSALAALGVRAEADEPVGAAVARAAAEAAERERELRASLDAAAKREDALRAELEASRAAADERFAETDATRRELSDSVTSALAALGVRAEADEPVGAAVARAAAEAAERERELRASLDAAAKREDALKAELEASRAAADERFAETDATRRELSDSVTSALAALGVRAEADEPVGAAVARAAAEAAERERELRASLDAAAKREDALKAELEASRAAADERFAETDATRRELSDSVTSALAALGVRAEADEPVGAAVARAAAEAAERERELRASLDAAAKREDALRAELEASRAAADERFAETDATRRELSDSVTSALAALGVRAEADEPVGAAVARAAAEAAERERELRASLDAAAKREDALKAELEASRAAADERFAETDATRRELSDSVTSALAALGVRAEADEPVGAAVARAAAEAAERERELRASLDAAAKREDALKAELEASRAAADERFAETDATRRELSDSVTSALAALGVRAEADEPVGAAVARAAAEAAERERELRASLDAAAKREDALKAELEASRAAADERFAETDATRRELSDSVTSALAALGVRAEADEPVGAAVARAAAEAAERERELRASLDAAAKREDALRAELEASRAAADERFAETDATRRELSDSVTSALAALGVRAEADEPVGAAVARAAAEAAERERELRASLDAAAKREDALKAELEASRAAADERFAETDATRRELSDSVTSALAALGVRAEADEPVGAAVARAAAEAAERERELRASLDAAAKREDALRAELEASRAAADERFAETDATRRELSDSVTSALAALGVRAEADEPVGAAVARAAAEAAERERELRASLDAAAKREDALKAELEASRAAADERFAETDATRRELSDSVTSALAALGVRAEADEPVGAAVARAAAEAAERERELRASLDAAAKREDALRAELEASRAAADERFAETDATRRELSDSVTSALAALGVRAEADEPVGAAVARAAAEAAERERELRASLDAAAKREDALRAELEASRAAADERFAETDATRRELSDSVTSALAALGVRAEADEPVGAAVARAAAEAAERERELRASLDAAAKREDALRAELEASRAAADERFAETDATRRELSDSVTSALAALGVRAEADEPVGAAVARAAAEAAERERELRASLDAAAKREDALKAELEASRAAADERFAETDATRRELSDSVTSALAALGVRAEADEPVGAAVARAAAEAAERERELRASLDAAAKREDALKAELEASRAAADERFAETDATRRELSDSVTSALAALGVRAEADEPVGAAVARAAAEAAERERELRASLDAAAKREDALKAELEASRAAADERFAETDATRRELSDSVTSALAALGVRAEADEPVGAAVARAAAEAAERERELRASLDAAAKREDALKAELEASRAAADERFAETDATRRELSDSVTSALAALGVRAEADEPVGAAVARAAAEAAERERELRASLDAAAKREDALKAELEASRAAADERFAETDATRRELSDSVTSALAALGVRAEADEPVGAAVARAAAEAAERERELRASLDAAAKREDALRAELEASRAAADERFAETDATRRELSDSVTSALAALGVRAEADEPVGAAVARAAAEAAERERELRASLDAAAKREDALKAELEASRAAADERFAETDATRRELSDSVTSALAALGVRAEADEPVGAAVARAAAEAAERERELRASLDAAAKREDALRAELEASRAAADERFAETDATRRELSDSVTSALAALGVRAEADEPVGAAVARAAAEAAERERELRASLDAAAKREDALKAELEASRAAADERFAETDATRRELSDSVTSALAALGVRAEADEPVGAAVARAAAEAAERERELRASLDAAAKREDALRAELEASRAAADERFAETDATRRELSDSVTSALAALGVRAEADEPVGAAVARAAAEAAERERELRASLDAAAKREDALRAELEASRAAADERFAETDATRRELSDSVTSALAALGVRAEADEPVGAAVARAAAEAAERERELRASLDAAAKREDALRAELEASRAAADERFAETDATRRELSDSVTSALAALGVRAEADEPVGAAVARAAAEAAERERELRASLDAAAKREDALRAELEASRAAADERFAETDATRRELSDSVTSALAALGVRAEADEPVGAAVARAAAEAAERERELRASLDAAAKREDALRAELEASRAAADERFAETDATRRELSDSVTSALAALGVRAEADEPVGAAVARAAAEAAERERELRASLDAGTEREKELESLLEATRNAALANHEKLRGKLDAAKEAKRQWRAVIRELEKHDERWIVVDGDVVVTSHCKVFKGDEWNVLMSTKKDELTLVFVSDAASACHVVQSSILDVVFEPDGFLVRFSVGHAGSVSAAEIDARLEEFPFNNVLDLYRHRHDSRSFEDGLLGRVTVLGNELEVVSSKLRAEEAHKEALLACITRALSELGVFGLEVDNNEGEALVEKAMEVAELQSQLQTDLAASVKREDDLVEKLRDAEKASLVQRDGEVDLKARLTTSCNIAAAYRMELAEADERLTLILTQVASSSLTLFFCDSLSVVTRLCSRLQSTPTAVCTVLDERLNELQHFRLNAEMQSREVIWRKDPRAMSALQQLHDTLADNTSVAPLPAKDASANEWHSTLISTLQLAYEEVQGGRATCLQKEVTNEALISLINQCGTSVQETRLLFGDTTSLPPPPLVEMATLTESRRQEHVLAACRALAAAAADCVGQRAELSQMLQSTLTTLRAALAGKAGATSVREGSGAAHQTVNSTSSGGPASVALLSQLPRLAQQVEQEMTELRSAAASVPGLTTAAQQRDALARRVATCCASLRRAAAARNATADCYDGEIASGNGDGSPAGVLGDEAHLSSEAAASQLSAVTNIVSCALRTYIEGTTQAIAALEDFSASERSGASPDNLPRRLLDLTDAVRLQVRQFARERGSLEEQHEREREESRRAAESSEKALSALRARCEAGEVENRNVTEELSVMQRNVSRLRRRWDAVGQIVGEFTQSVHAAATDTAAEPSTLSQDISALVARCTLLSEGDETAVESLQSRLAEVRDACQQCRSHLRRADSCVEALKEQKAESSATVALLKDRVSQLAAKLESSRALLAKMEADAAAQEEAAERAHNSTVAAHRAALAAAEAERTELASKVTASTLEVTRLTTVLHEAEQRFTSQQARVSQLQHAAQEREAEVAACLSAVGGVSTLSEAGGVVAACRQECKKQALEAAQEHDRRELVQQWATTMHCVPDEVCALRRILWASAQTLPGVPLSETAMEVQRLQRDLAEAERVLGVPASHVSVDHAATREALLQAVRRVHQLFFPPNAELGSQQTGSEPSSRNSPLPAPPMRTRATSAAAAWCASPEKLVDAVARLMESQQMLQESEEEAQRGAQLWCSVVRCACDALQSALLSAGGAQDIREHHTDDSGSHERASFSSAAPQDAKQQQSVLKALQTVTRRAVTHVTERADLLRQLREPLQSCLPSLETSLEKLVACAVEEIEALRSASRAAVLSQRHSDDTVASLTSALQSAAAALPGDAPFLTPRALSSSTPPMGELAMSESGGDIAAGTELMHKCQAYAVECARLSTQERELCRVLGGSQANGMAKTASSSLISVTEGVTAELVHLRERVVPRLEALLRAAAVDNVVGEETADRMSVLAAEATSRARVSYVLPLRDLREQYQDLFSQTRSQEHLLTQRSDQLRRQQEGRNTSDAAVIESVGAQKKSLQVMGVGSREANGISDDAPAGAADVVKREAQVLPQLAEPHGTLAAQSARQSEALKGLATLPAEKVTHHRDVLSKGQDELVWEHRCTVLAGFAKELGRVLKLSLPTATEGEVEPTAQSVDLLLTSLPHITSAVLHVVHELDRHAASEAKGTDGLDKSAPQRQPEEDALQARPNKVPVGSSPASATALEDAVSARGRQEGAAAQKTQPAQNQQAGEAHGQHGLPEQRWGTETAAEALAASQAAAVAKERDALQQRLAEVHRLLSSAMAATRARVAMVLAEGVLPLSARSGGGVEAYVEGTSRIIEQLVFHLEESQDVVMRLRELPERREEGSRTGTAAERCLATLWSALHGELLPHLLNDYDHDVVQQNDHHHTDSTVSSASSPLFHREHGAVVSEDMITAAVASIHEAVRRVQGLREDMHDIYASLQRTFGESCSTNSTAPDNGSSARVTTSTAGAVTRVRVRNASLADMVHATASLIGSVVAAKCTSTMEFLQEIEADLLSRPSPFAKVSFATLRPVPFAEWLQHIMEDLRAMQLCSERRHNQLRRLPLFMDALVELVHSHGGRVDLAAFDQPETLVVAQPQGATPFTSYPISANDDFAEINEQWQECEKEAVLDGLQALLATQDTALQRATANLEDVMAQKRQLELEQAEAENIVLELRQRVQHKVLEDQKVEESFRELDRHLDMQVRELALKYQAEQDGIVHRLSAMRSTLHAVMEPAYTAANASSPYWSPRGSKHGCSTSTAK